MTEQNLITAEQAEQLAFRQRISRKMLEDERDRMMATPGLKRRMIMRKLMTTVTGDFLVQANAQVIMTEIYAESDKRLQTIDLKNPEKNRKPIHELFTLSVTPASAKLAMQSFVVRREFSRRLREAVPKSTPDGVISETEFRQMQSEMAAHNPTVEDEHAGQ